MSVNNGRKNQGIYERAPARLGTLMLMSLAAAMQIIIDCFWQKNESLTKYFDDL